MKKILVAVDGSKHSKKAAKKGAELAKFFNSELTLINIISKNNTNSISIYYAIAHTSRVLEKREDYIERGKKILQETNKLVSEIGITAKTEVDIGNPAILICDYAVKNNFDLIVIGDKGLGSIKNFLLGNITDKVLHHAKKSVLVVK